MEETIGKCYKCNFESQDAQEFAEHGKNGCTSASRSTKTDEGKILDPKTV